MSIFNDTDPTLEAHILLAIVDSGRNNRHRSLLAGKGWTVLHLERDASEDYEDVTVNGAGVWVTHEVWTACGIVGLVECEENMHHTYIRLNAKGREKLIDFITGAGQ